MMLVLQYVFGRFMVFSSRGHRYVEENGGDWNSDNMTKFITQFKEVRNYYNGCIDGIDFDWGRMILFAK